MIFISALSALARFGPIAGNHCKAVSSKLQNCCTSLYRTAAAVQGYAGLVCKESDRESFNLSQWKAGSRRYLKIKFLGFVAKWNQSCGRALLFCPQVRFTDSLPTSGVRKN